MKILFLAQEPTLQRTEVVTGNAIRLDQLRTALLAAGHEVVHTWLAGAGHAAPGSFRSRDELQGLILAHAPDVILVAYWELAALLPFDLPQPVVLDFVAPRPLEALFENPQSVRAELRRLRENLQRCDLILVSNQQQKQLLINTLIEAGFDLRQGIPVTTVPLGAAPIGAPATRPGAAGWVLVSGGVSWPWRKSQHYLPALARAARANAQPVRVVQFGGAYRWHGPAPAPAAQASVPEIESRPLLPYQQFSEFLSQHAHIGVELADWNIERANSQSFRSLEFLRHGLPLLCNRYLPIAELVERYGAGWLVDSPEQLPELLDVITADAEGWHRRSIAALNLVEAELQPDRSVRPLIEWLDSPAHAPRLPAETRGSEEVPVLGVPPLGERLRRQYRLMKEVTLRRLIGQRAAGPGILLVTRGDLFPPDHGAAVRTLETARALGRSGLPVGIVTDDNRHWHEYADGEFKPRRFPVWVRLLSAPSALVKLLHYSKDLPRSNSFLYLPLSDGGFFWRTMAAGRKIRAGILHAEFPAYVSPCIKARDLLHCRVVLVEHNVEYQRLRAQVPELTEAQYRNLREIEIDLGNRCDAVVCVSDADRARLIADGLRSSLMHTISHGVNLAEFTVPAKPGLRETYGVKDDEPLLVFHGTFSYPPNRTAIRIFAETLLPRLEELGLRCHVLAIGRDPPPSSPHERIHFTGSVREVAPWLKAADLAVIPLTEGGGTRMKIIDCFAAGLPLVSTSKGIEGIPVVPGRQALVIDDWTQMCDAIARLWREPELRQSLAREARAMAEGLDWSAIASRLRSVYSSLV